MEDKVTTPKVDDIIVSAEKITPFLKDIKELAQKHKITLYGCSTESNWNTEYGVFELKINFS